MNVRHLLNLSLSRINTTGEDFYLATIVPWQWSEKEKFAELFLMILPHKGIDVLFTQNATNMQHDLFFMPPKLKTLLRQNIRLLEA